MIILRLNRSPISQEQREALEKLYPNAEVRETIGSAGSLADVKAHVEKHSADVLEADLVLPVLLQCLDPKNGIRIPIMFWVREEEPQKEPFSYYEIYREASDVTQINRPKRRS